MLVSFNWLKELCDIRQGIDAAAEALTSRGLTVDAVEKSSDGEDFILDIDIPANRPDCLGHLGLARELAAAFGKIIGTSHDVPEERGAAIEDSVRVIIDDPDLCMRYTARVVRDVRVGPSPDWVVRRLESCGMRSINNVVDASNMVLLGSGHPIHTFDLERLALADDGRFEIRIRRAARKETLTTLDGVERKLDPDMLLIADSDNPVALAGVMGGADTEIQHTTNEVLIEAAWFHPRSVRKTAKSLGLHTDASHRFERGVDPDGVLFAQEMAVSLLCELAGGTAAPGCIDSYPSPAEPRALELDPTRVERLLGYHPGDDDILAALQACGLQCVKGTDGNISAIVPSWRVDIERDADLVEEIARHLGYDRIPARMPPSGRLSVQETTHPLEERTREILAHLGFHEAFNYAMLSSEEDADFLESDSFAPLALDNPIAEQLTFLRRSILPGLISSVDRNQRRGVRDIRLFEIGRIFLPTGNPGEFPYEPLRAGIAWSGAGEPRHHGGEDRTVEIDDIAGIVEATITRLRPGFIPSRSSCRLPGLHPGRSLSWEDESGRTIAWCGSLHPDMMRKFDIAQPTYVAEMDLDRVLEVPSRGFRHSPLPRVPAVSRDLSMVLPAGSSFAEVVEILENVESPAPVTFDVIDRYHGAPLSEGEVSITVRAILQPLELTLTDEETEQYRGRLVNALEKERNFKLR